MNQILKQKFIKNHIETFENIQNICDSIVNINTYQNYVFSVTIIILFLRFLATLPLLTRAMVNNQKSRIN